MCEAIRNVCEAFVTGRAGKLPPSSPLSEAVAELWAAGGK